MIGKTILHYRILEELGRGGMGVVYKAEDTKLDRIVAIKFLPGHIAANEEDRKRFAIEAKAAAALNHPNITTIHTVEEVDGESFIVMEYIAGRELKETVGASGRSPLALETMLDYAAQIAAGLQAAHEKGVIHRDIKSANIMITEKGQIKIMDFGLAKVRGGTQLTKEHSTLGTVSYMSPEQALGEDTDHRSDIWSFGVVLFEMLTGQMPFPGEHDSVILHAIIHNEPVSIADKREDVPFEIEQITNKCLQKNKEHRYVTCADILIDLKKEMHGELQSLGKGAKEDHLKRRTGFRLSRKQRRHSYQTLVVIMVLIIAFGIYLWQGGEVEATQLSIAVLPLKSITNAPDQEWFTLGMTDALTTELAKIGGLRVISQSSVMQYKDNPKPIPQIALELNVDYVLDASIFKVGEEVRISAKLINASENEHLWAENFQREFKNLLKLQGEIAYEVANQVKIKLTPQEKQRLEQFEQEREIDPEAYAAYLKGRYLSRWTGSQTILKSFDEFRTAIKLAPEFAAAYAGLADAYVTSAAQGFLSPNEGFAQAKETALQALDIDPESSEAYEALGYAGLLLDHDWDATEKHLLKAIQLNPSNTLAIQRYAIYLTAVARHDEAIATIKKAVRLDPVSPMISSLEGLLYYFSRDNEQAIKVLNRALVTHPKFSFAYYWLAAAQTELQQYDKALENIKKALELDPKDAGFFLRNWLGKLYARLGQRQDALAVAKEIEEQGGEASYIYIDLGENDKAFAAIEHYFENQYAVALFKVAPWYDPIRSDPRFKDVLERAGLDD